MTVKFGRSVFFPQPAEDLPEPAAVLTFRALDVMLVEDCNGFGDLPDGEVFGQGLTGADDKCTTGCNIAGVVGSRFRRGEQEISESLPAAFRFGWARSFCSASNCSATRFDVNDWRSRLPRLSRQSA